MTEYRAQTYVHIPRHYRRPTWREAITDFIRELMPWHPR